MTLENEPMIAQPPLFRAGVVDTRINNVLALLPPVAVIEKFPTTEEADKLVCATRQAIHDAMKGESDRLVVITGDHARLLRETSYHRGLEGPHQRP